MVNFFGTSNAIVTPITALVGAVMVLGSMIFRKVVANEVANMPFSVIGSSVPGILSFLIASNLLPIKWSLLIGLICFFAGGFLVGDLLGDGEASG